MGQENVRAANRRLFWGAVWLGVILIATKAYYLGLPKPHGFADLIEYVRSLAAISYTDLWFVAGLWALSRLVVSLLAAWPIPVSVFSCSVIAVSAFCCLYAVANVVIFSVFGGFLTYPLLALVGDVRMVRSSVGAHLTMPVISGLVGVPLAYADPALGQQSMEPIAHSTANAPHCRVHSPRRLDIDRIWDVGTDVADPPRSPCRGKFRMGVSGVVLAGFGPIGHRADVGAVFNRGPHRLRADRREARFCRARFDGLAPQLTRACVPHVVRPT